MYEGSEAAIRTPYLMTRKMDITVGVHQGSAPIPFEEHPFRTILYADDIALVADNQKELEEKVHLWPSRTTAQLNVKSTKFFGFDKCTGS
ncbi:unnamed protein product [Heligmosomoides polygyrus]|uniref:Reverse transcriptase domain-containing protein n=1 Tax=Heligmosomoides polygyrus TaxID=6339 RepID=A0A183GMF1_HELPZ|nr:unnamed protein product [Heligmosomoides polygyrus]